DTAFDWPDLTRFQPIAAPAPDSAALRRASNILTGARNPVILMGRGSRTTEAMQARVVLAERCGAIMLSDLKTGTMVPTDHPNHAGAPFNKLSTTARDSLRQADVILSLGWVDLGGVLKQAFGTAPRTARIIH